MLLVEEEAAGIKESASEVSRSSETEGGPQKKKPRKGLLSLLEDMMDTLSMTGDDPQEAAKKYKNTFVLILIQQKIQLNGGKHTVHNYLFCLLWHGNIYAFQPRLCLQKGHLV